jgi:nitronate monooxygenase
MSSNDSLPYIKTPLNALLPHLKTPIVLGPLANAAGGDLCGAVSAAGGFGFIGAGYYTSSTLEKELALAYSHLGLRNNTFLEDGQRAEFGVGFLVWRLTALNGGVKPTAVSEDGKNIDVESPAVVLIDTALKAKPRAIWLSFGDEEEMRSWSRVVRAREAAINSTGAGKRELKLFVMIGTENELRNAVEDCGADVLVVQGNESGGHGWAASPPLSAILPTVIRKIQELKPGNPDGLIPLVLGAGGLSNGSTLAAAMALGAVGGVFGTRFLLTPQAQYTPLQKQLLVDAHSDQTIRTYAFDDARGTIGWPTGVDGRGIYNDTVREYEDEFTNSSEVAQNQEAIKRRRDRYDQAVKDGDPSRIVTWSGTGVGNMNEIKDAGAVVREITFEAVAALEKAGGWIVHE